MKRFHMLFSQCLALSLVGALLAGAMHRAFAESISLVPAKDNTLYEFHIDPENPSVPINSNGEGNFFSAGCTRSRGQIQRGLLQFEFPDHLSGSLVVPGSVSLQLYVVDVPKQEKPLQDRPFWLVRVPTLPNPWGEGGSATIAGQQGAGSGAEAQPEDATWFHTWYTPDDHEDALGQVLPFTAGATKFWPEGEGLLGGDALDPWTLYGTPAGWAGDDGKYVSLTSPSMAADIQAWLDNPASNFGWVVVGDETVDDPKQSSKRGFASREYDAVAYQPLLTFQYVPEPGSWMLLGLGLVGLVLVRTRKARRFA